MSIPHLTADSFRAAAAAPGLTLIEFSAPWCPPCKALLPILEELSQEERDAAIYQVNVDDHPELASEFGVMGMPTVFLFRSGEPLEKLVGLRPKPAYAAVIRKHAAERTVS
ncbi:thioredoxin family protein [Paenibacillus antri]|uniref:Thioredoxin n=1 Tax=Paenibacillus antri TaxID=2582848 RepID=A0A5R9G759_9BACL|nr:thioredoxin family protein [Paenibacillus antri]TLS52237.1 thioredoxin family protein [Paenibacillus antri]